MNSSSTASATALISSQLALDASSWSIGRFGAIGEFIRSGDEACESGPVSAITRRGGIRYEPEAVVQARAYELLSARPGRWQHGIVFCVPSDQRLDSGVIAELGPDTNPLRFDERDHVLFDLGVGGASCRFCVRTADAALIRTLRAAVGARLLDLGDRLWAALLAASPHRVLLSRLGRIEIFEGIADTQGSTPRGPHTHLIPRLLRQRRHHSAAIPVPAGMLPAISLYPANPLQNRWGLAKPFASAEHSAFQALLERYGDEQAWCAKRNLVEAIERGADPGSWVSPPTRAGRVACKVAMRQLRHERGLTPAIRLWEIAVGEPARAEADA